MDPRTCWSAAPSDPRRGPSLRRRDPRIVARTTSRPGLAYRPANRAMQGHNKRDDEQAEDGVGSSPTGRRSLVGSSCSHCQLPIQFAQTSSTIVPSASQMPFPPRESHQDGNQWIEDRQADEDTFKPTAPRAPDRPSRSAGRTSHVAKLSTAQLLNRTAPCDSARRGPSTNPKHGGGAAVVHDQRQPPGAHTSGRRQKGATRGRGARHSRPVYLARRARPRGVCHPLGQPGRRRPARRSGRRPGSRQPARRRDPGE